MFIKLIEKLFLCFVFFIGIMSSSAYDVIAAPSIIGVSGSFIHGQTVTISGTGFGSKSTAAPVKWDNFETGTTGQEITTQGYAKYNTGTGHVYSTTNKHGGSKSASISSSGESFTASGLNNLSLDEMYLTFWVWWERTSGYESVLKFLRISSGDDMYNSWPGVWMSGIGISSWQVMGIVPGGSTGETQTTLDAMIGPGQWTRMGVYYKHSTGGAENGTVQFWWGSTLSINNVNKITRYAANDSLKIKNIILPFMTDEGNGSYNVYIDDLYIDRTQARVEICLGSTWENRSSCEIQLPTAWNDMGQSISFTVNQGAIPTSATRYLYVVDAIGRSNSNGHAINFGQSIGGSKPIPPRNLSIQ